MRRFQYVLIAALAARAAPSLGADIDTEAPATAGESPGWSLAADGDLLPQALTARVGHLQALALGSGGYDSSRRGPLVDSAVEVRLWGALALRAGATYSNESERMRPNVGARAQLLRQEAHGLDGALTVFYKAEGFTESEGEVETIVSIGRRVDKWYLLGNLVYGQDFDGNERDGEVRGAAFYALRRRMTIGVDARTRFAIGAQHGHAAVSEPSFDVAGGPVATVAIGSFAAFAECGPSALRLPGMPTRVGVATLAGIGTGF